MLPHRIHKLPLISTIAVLLFMSLMLNIKPAKGADVTQVRLKSYANSLILETGPKATPGRTLHKIWINYTPIAVQFFNGRAELPAKFQDTMFLYINIGTNSLTQGTIYLKFKFFDAPFLIGPIKALLVLAVIVGLILLKIFLQIIIKLLLKIALGLLIIGVIAALVTGHTSPEQIYTFIKGYAIQAYYWIKAAG